VTILQLTHLLSGGSSDITKSGYETGYIRKSMISEMAGLPPSTVTNSLLDMFRCPTCTFDHVERAVDDIMCEGYAA
jgi:hypothetical protein